MMWIDQKEHKKHLDKIGFGKDKAICSIIGHVTISQFDNETWDMHKICFNCGTDFKDSLYHIYKLPPTLPIRLYSAYGIPVPRSKLELPRYNKEWTNHLEEV